MKKRVFGYDDCQIACPWNRFSIDLTTKDFLPRHKLYSSTLLELFNWTEEEFLKRTEGFPIRRLGYNRWLRNIAIAIGIGNSPYSEANIKALQAKADFDDEDVREHVVWVISKVTGSNYNRT